MSGEKTEKPTPQKLKKARDEGQIGKTPDLGAWAGIAAASVLVPMTLEKAVVKAREVVLQWPDMMKDPDAGAALNMFRDGLMGAAYAVAPLAVSMMLIGIAGSGAQGGIHVATKLLMPKFSRLNPLQGFKRIVGMQALWEGTKALIKTTVLGAVLYMQIKDLVPSLMSSGNLPLAVLLDMVKDAVISLIRTAALAGLVMAAADYFVVRMRTMKQLKMSKQEIKDEYKKTEGDPHVKGQIRARQHAMSRNRMMSDVPKADVVLVNPTHVAVAMRYEPEKGAPRVIAKGQGNVAQKIRDLATENRIPMIQDVPLARALYGSCEIGAEIPAEFYGAVAKVLAFVMSLKSRGSAAGTHRLAA
ncbi:flagellar biosynthesis protein FlhB [Catenuloplanes japonicus]|uniref:flagellar biosynthesis protein FlhB n=1 Tax=Catenuloplanes japonicus TaxID=33876 RepID=UPI0005274298|nr:flagellar biosynthesis protein FlhB [Catenuloplanes japonicus]